MYPCRTTGVLEGALRVTTTTAVTRPMHMAWVQSLGYQIMRKLLRKRIPTQHLLLVSVLGVLGGIYIWKPFFEQLREKQAEDSKTNNLEKASSIPNPPASRTWHSLRSLCGLSKGKDKVLVTFCDYMLLRHLFKASIVRFVIGTNPGKALK